MIYKIIPLLTFLLYSSSLYCLENSNIIAALGDRQTLLSNGSLGLEYFPDEALAVMQTKPVFRALVSAVKYTYLIEGKDIRHLETVRKVIEPGSPGSPDNGYAGVSGAFYNRGTWYAVYHGEDQEGMPQIGGGIPGFYCRVFLASSANEGLDWQKLGPVIQSSKPKEWTFFKGQADRGTGDPGLVVDKNKKFVYLYYTEHSRMDNRGVQVCMARAAINENIEKGLVFYKYYNGDFKEPGIGGKETPLFNLPGGSAAETEEGHVVYSPFLNKYIMTLNIDYWQEFVLNTGLKKSGIYISYSDDGVAWSDPEMLIKDYSQPLIGKSVSCESIIVFDDKSGREGWLVYGYSPRWGHDDNKSGIPHYMAGNRISFKIKS